MKALIQRVSTCEVKVNAQTVGEIGRGLLVLLGVHPEDTDRDLELLARKCIGLRVFPDGDGKMNLSVTDIGGEIIVVSQFTLFGDVKRGMRPFFGDAAEPAKAEKYYERFMETIDKAGVPVQGGRFGAHMRVHLINDGPVTLMIDTREM